MGIINILQIICACEIWAHHWCHLTANSFYHLNISLKARPTLEAKILCLILLSWSNSVDQTFGLASGIFCVKTNEIISYPKRSFKLLNQLYRNLGWCTVWQWSNNWLCTPILWIRSSSTLFEWAMSLLKCILWWGHVMTNLLWFFFFCSRSSQPCWTRFHAQQFLSSTNSLGQIFDIASRIFCVETNEAWMFEDYMDGFMIKLLCWVNRRTFDSDWLARVRNLC